MKIRFAPTYINKDGMRTLARANQGRNHFDTREAAEKWLAAVLSNPNSDKRMWGDVSKMRVDAIECHDHGDAVGIFISPYVKPYDVSNLDSFTRAYIDCMLWTDQERLKEDASQHEDEFEPARKWDVNVHALHADTLASIVEECRAFQEDQATNLAKAYMEQNDYTPERAGHDFWLTRNGHGAGYWDRGFKNGLGRLISNAAKSCGTSDLYFGDDGKLYVS